MRSRPTRPSWWRCTGGTIPHDGYISGEQVQEEVVDHLEPRGWRHVVQHDDRDFIIDVLELAGRWTSAEAGPLAEAQWLRSMLTRSDFFLPE